jgi:hypothetical protein
MIARYYIRRIYQALAFAVEVEAAQAVQFHFVLQTLY